MANTIYKTQFISIDYLKANTPIEDNVDDNKLTPNIILAQTTHIQTYLGSSFYNRLKEGYALKNITDDEDYFVKEYLMPCLAQWALYESIPFIKYKLNNKGMNEESSEFGAPSSEDAVKFLRNSVRDTAEFLGERLVTYLCDNYNLFDKYNNPDVDENLSKNSQTYFSGIYVPKKTSRKRRR
ncbi:MAG: Unknown protein [uncultured Sulfurovum sp.]|uniref:Uncharacterized protein n=1 Tax=uncultured Sulfurovum sp. TaxID=269237 RepID=A0A6S6T1H0_9BACT|nr:MAG: Unknown protein [uncultured Sulfurovum sp.]